MTHTLLYCTWVINQPVEIMINLNCYVNRFKEEISAEESRLGVILPTIRTVAIANFGSELKFLTRISQKWLILVGLTNEISWNI